MMDIAENEYKGNVSMKDVSERENISLKYLEQIVNVLCKMGLVKSQRGSQGGYRLTKSADKYTVGSIIRAIDGNFSDDYIPVNDAAIKSFWSGLYDVINDYIDSVTISDLIECRRNIYEYYI